jgi:hypothetical protein
MRQSGQGTKVMSWTGVGSDFSEGVREGGGGTGVLLTAPCRPGRKSSFMLRVIHFTAIRESGHAKHEWKN